MKKLAIVLSTHTMGMGVIRSLGMMGVPIVAVYYDKGDMGYLSRYVKERIYSPHPIKAEEQFIALLLKMAVRFKGSLLIPANDEVLMAVSRHKDLLEQNYIVACTEWEITERFIDKMYTYKIAESVGVPAPRTVAPESLDDLDNKRHLIEYPCIVKARHSHLYYDIFRVKMVKVNDYDQLVAAFQQAKNANLKIIIQELIPGSDSQVVNYNSYFWNGEPLVEVTAQQIRKAPPEFGAPRVVLSKVIPEIIKPGRDILRAMGFYGYSCTEFKWDSRDNVYKLMEVNGRHNRSTLLAVSCGLNIPWLQYRHLIWGEMPSQSSYRTGVYWISLERDIGYSLRYYRKERYSIIKYLLPYLKPHVLDVLTWKDPMPFIGRCYYLCENAIQHTFFRIKRKINILKGGGKSNEKRCHSA